MAQGGEIMGAKARRLVAALMRWQTASIRGIGKNQRLCAGYRHELTNRQQSHERTRNR